MTIAELRAEIAKKEREKQSPHNEVMYLHQKFAVPGGLPGVRPAGAQPGRLEQQGQQARQLRGRAGGGLRLLRADDDRLVADQGALAAGQPGAVAAEHRPGRSPASALLVYRHRHADAGVQISLPTPAAIRALDRSAACRGGGSASPAVEASVDAAREAQSAAKPSSCGRAGPAGEGGARASRPRGVARAGAASPSDAARRLRRQGLPAGAACWPSPACSASSTSGRSSTGRTISSRARRRRRSWRSTLWYSTPQFVYYVLPLSALVGTLVTIGLLTKSSELIVMRACGVSLYRTALPLLVLGLLWSGMLFGLEESFLAASNRKAAELKHLMRGGAAAHVRRPGAPMGRRPRRPPLSLHLLRSAGQDR